MTENKKLLDLYKENVHDFYNIDYIVTIYDKKSDYKDVSVFLKKLKKIIESNVNNNTNTKIDPITGNIRESVKTIIYELFNKPIEKIKKPIEKIEKNKTITVEQLHQIVKRISEAIQQATN